MKILPWKRLDVGRQAHTNCGVLSTRLLMKTASMARVAWSII